MREWPREVRQVDLEYEAYLTAEWEKFVREEDRFRASLEATRGTEIRRVLDVGCGAGQELRPFVATGAFAIGADLASDVGLLGRKMFEQDGLSTRVAFVRSAAERLPFATGAFDVVISRVALPYANNPLAIGEMARVLRPGGLLLLKIHHAWFYVDEAWRGLRGEGVRKSVHSARVLASGLAYHLTRKHFCNRLFTHETCQTRWLLEKELARRQLVIVREMPDSNRLTPAFLIRKESTRAVVAA